MPIDKDDDLMGDIRAAMTQDMDAPPADPVVQEQSSDPPQETAQQRTDRERDEQGRFAKAGDKPRETLTLKEPKEAPAAPATQQPPAGQPQAAQPVDPTKDRIAPPSAWLGAAKTKWDRLPREVQQEIASREVERETATADMLPLRDLIESNKALLVSEAGSVPAAMAELMKLAQMSVANPVALIQTIAARRGIDLRALVGGQQGQEPAPGQQQPDLLGQVRQLIQQELQPVAAQFQQQSQQQLQSTVNEIKAFAADPAHPFFNDVSKDIEFLLSSDRIPPGPPLQRLQQAYEQATWANPTIRPHLLGAQAEEANQRRAAEVDKARKAASASLRGSPLPGAVANGSANPNATVHDDVRAAYAEVSGA